MQTRLNAEAARRAAVVICAIGATEAAFIVAFPLVLLRPAFRGWNAVGAAAWIAASIVTVSYVVYSVRGLPAVATLLTRVSPFKLVTFVIAVPASIVEEVVFRTILMNQLAMHQVNVELQILASGVAFGVVHFFWGFRGGVAAVIGAVGSTTLMGIALAVVFVMAGRLVFPCVAAHFAINVVLEPWLLYARELQERLARRAETARCQAGFRWLR